jgi:DNA-binding NtrC family response regulator
MQGRVLVVDDEKAMVLALKGLLSREGYEVETAGGGAEAVERIERGRYHVVITDLSMNGVGGMQVLEHARRVDPDTAVIMITAYGSEKVAVQAMKSGAADYIPKPFDNDEIRLVVARALERTRLARENRLLLDRVQREYGFENLIGAGEAMQRVFAAIQKVAETDLTVLVRGESGTGKELVAQALHQRSRRRDRPFVAVNCAAISAELVESELFGHEKGAFTGADARREGRFEAADGGTIFLDEIGDMAPATQAKVLRVIQQRSFERVGGRDAIEVDVRIVAATHCNLEQAVARGAFREDLYYRLRVIELVLPPLRERREDVPALALRFLEQVNERHGRSGPRLSERALAALARHAWPGNVRELRNAIEQAAVLADGDAIGEEDLRLDGAPANALPAARAAASELAGLPFAEAKRRAVERFERAFLLDALRASGGNISRAADAVGMVRQSLQQKIRDLGLRDEEWRKT